MLQTFEYGIKYPDLSVQSNMDSSRMYGRDEKQGISREHHTLLTEQPAPSSSTQDTAGEEQKLVISSYGSLVGDNAFKLEDSNMIFTNQADMKSEHTHGVKIDNNYETAGSVKIEDVQGDHSAKPEATQDTAAEEKHHIIHDTGSTVESFSHSATSSTTECTAKYSYGGSIRLAQTQANAEENTPSDSTQSRMKGGNGFIYRIQNTTTWYIVHMEFNG